MVAGGVGANRKLRERLVAIAAMSAAEVYFPRAEFCTDNGAMIALAGCLRLTAGTGAPQALSLGARARWPLEDNV